MPLAFFGAVPRSVLYDNDRCLVAKIMPDDTRQRTQRFSAMLSHYVIGDRYGRPGKGNDKGKVEGLVGYGRRNFMVPNRHSDCSRRPATELLHADPDDRANGLRLCWRAGLSASVESGDGAACFSAASAISSSSAKARLS